MKKLIIISLILLILTIGTVSASENITSDEPTTDDTDISNIPTVTQDNTISSDDAQDAIIPTQENSTSPIKSSEKLNVSYEISIDKEYLAKNGFESNFEIEMYEREFLNGNLKIYIDDDLKYNDNPKTDYNNQFESDGESSEYRDSYSILDINFLDRLSLTYGQHKAEFIYTGDPLFNDFYEIRYFNYTPVLFYVPEDENEYESTCHFYVESHVVTGNLKIVLDNETIHNEYFNGYEYIDLEDLNFGTHTYDLYFTGNKNLKPIDKHGTFNRTYEFNAYLTSYEFYEEILIDDIANLIISLPSDATSNVTVVVNNKTYSSSVNYGNARITITNLKLGENIIRLTYKDEKYYERTIVKNVTVLPSLHFPYPISSEYENDTSVTLIMPADAQGTLKLRIDDEYFTSNLVNGTASIPLNRTIIGTHDFEITYIGDYEQYFENQTYRNITIFEEEYKDLKDWDLEFTLNVKYINDSYYVYGEGYYYFDMDLSMPNDITGTQTYCIDGKECTSYNPENESPFDYGASWINTCEYLGQYYSELSNGTHTFTVRHSGDDNYMAKSKTVTFTKPLNEKIVSGLIIKVGENVTIELPKGENGTAIITINNTTETITIENETYISHPLNLAEGLWDITVTYTGNHINKTKEVKLDTRVEYFSLECEDYYLKDSTKEAYLNDYTYEDESSFLKHIEVFIDNKKSKATYDEYNYEYKINLNKLSSGTHNIRVNYKNNKKVIVQSVTKTFKIFSYSYPKIQLGDIYSQEMNDKEKMNQYNNYKYGYMKYLPLSLANNTTLIMNLDLDEKVNGNVSVYITDIHTYYSRYGDKIDDSDWTDAALGDMVHENTIELYDHFDLKNGKSKITLPTSILNSTYGLKLVINLENGHVINKSIDVSWQPKVEHPSEMKYGDNETLTICVPGVTNVMIGMFGNFEPIYSKIINGTAKFPISTLPVADRIKTTFVYMEPDANGKWVEHTADYNLKLNIKGFTPKLIGSKKAITMYYNDGTAYSLKVSGVYGKIVGKGETVTFKIGKHTFKRQTDKNGIVKLTIPSKIKPGKYKITATYKGVKVSKKLTVKKHVISLKTVKVKKSAKKLVLTAQLTKKLKNKKVTFKFNGKTYKTKTDKKGIAKVTIKSGVLKKLNVGKKVTYQATYLKDTIKRTAKVKK